MISDTAIVCICVGSGDDDWGGGPTMTHLIPPECLQVIQDLPDEGLTQLVDL